MKRILIITNDSYDYIKIFINHTVKYAKGFIQLGHGFRSFSYNGLLKEISLFKNKRIKKKFTKIKLTYNCKILTRLILALSLLPQLFPVTIRSSF